jgi:CBS domain-containing protein
MQQTPLARDFMVTRLITVSPETDILDGIRLLLRNGISGAPVVDQDGRYHGVLSEKCSLGVLTMTARLARERGALEPDSSRASDFMTRRLITFGPETNAFEAIGQLLEQRISGAPVIGDNGEFLGVFSEKFAMNLLVALAYDQMPTPNVRAFMNTDRSRIIDENMDVLTVAQIFLDTPFRRLPVLTGHKLVGQVSRRDVLQAQHHLSSQLNNPGTGLLAHSRKIPTADSERAYDHGDLESTAVSSFMDRRARTIEENTDLLEIAHIFLTTPYRRLPVLRSSKLVGQISRRNVLKAARALFEKETRSVSPLYFSAVLGADEVPPALR